MIASDDKWLTFTALASIHLVTSFAGETKKREAGSSVQDILIRAVLQASIVFALFLSAPGALIAAGVGGGLGATYVLTSLVSRRFRSPGVFVGMQAINLAASLGAAHLLVDSSELPWHHGWSVESIPSPFICAAVLAGAYFAVVVGGDHFMTRFMQSYLQKSEGVIAPADGRTASPLRELEGAGRIIGRAERALTLIFLLIGEPAGVGFLIVAKSIFWFGALRGTGNREAPVRIFIGTLASFSYALVVGELVSWWVRVWLFSSRFL